MDWKIFALLSALFAALTTLFGKLGVQGVDSNLATAVRVVVILLFSWGIALCAGVAGQVARWSSRTWLFLALSGISTGLSWLFYFRALQDRPRLPGGALGQAQRPPGNGPGAGLPKGPPHLADAARRRPHRRRDSGAPPLILAFPLSVPHFAGQPTHPK